jgi:hypothetical protein
MGNWTIIIEGTGAHHGRTEHDADELTRDFVHRLVARGQRIEHATFTSSSRERVEWQSVPQADGDGR